MRHSRIPSSPLKRELLLEATSSTSGPPFTLSVLGGLFPASEAALGGLWGGGTEGMTPVSKYGSSDLDLPDDVDVVDLIVFRALDDEEVELIVCLDENSMSRPKDSPSSSSSSMLGTLPWWLEVEYCEVDESEDRC